MGAQLTSESAYGAGCLVHGLVVLGRTEEAERVLESHIPRFQQSFGKVPLFAATLNAERASVSALRGDSIARRLGVASAWGIIDVLPDVPLSDRLALGMSFVDDAWSRSADSEALKVSLRMSEQMTGTGAPMFSIYAQLYLGIARLRLKDWVGAEQALRLGIAQLPASHDLNSMLPRLRRPLAEALQNQNRIREADSLRVLDPPSKAVPPCTPGGDWRGCPDAK
ncbi:MAG: hypothetical protein ABI852_07515 [Gemmatimonadaceae bacterium]